MNRRGFLASLVAAPAGVKAAVAAAGKVRVVRCTAPLVENPAWKTVPPDPMWQHICEHISRTNPYAQLLK